ncbi:hypothetical protein C0J45_16098 [Silurus meridionalis]|nr:hypothetical protein C0J45_16098 [Silurus meridionalis]
MAVGCGHLWTVILLCLIGQTAAFGELDERDWEYLGSDVASLHRLKGLANRFKHQPIRVQHDYKLRTPRESDGYYEALQRHSKWNNRNKGSISYSEPTNNPRSSAILAEHVHSELQKTFGEKVQKLHVKPDSVTIRDGEFQCELVFDTNLAEVKKWKFPLPEESKILMEKLKTNVKEVSEMTTIHTTSVHLEEAGKLLGVTGLLLSAQGAVKAFEHGDIKTGVVATLQTIHGVTGMTLAALGQQVTVVAENKAMKAISTGLKNPAFKRTMGIVMPVTGIAFGIYNIAEDLKRGGAQGMIDLTLDTLMVDLDIVEV